MVLFFKYDVLNIAKINYIFDNLFKNELSKTKITGWLVALQTDKKYSRIRPSFSEVG